MAYASWSVSFGEKPSAAKWNILGTNDASFNDGTGIAGLYKNLLSVDSNPYKFRVSRNAAYNSGNNAFSSAVAFDTEQYDTNNNVSSGVYTAPVAGFYRFQWNSLVGTTASGQGSCASIFKNGSEVSRGSFCYSSSTGQLLGSAGCDIVQLSASDTVDVRVFATTTLPGQVGVTTYNYFSGSLVSRT